MNYKAIVILCFFLFLVLKLKAEEPLIVASGFKKGTYYAVANSLNKVTKNKLRIIETSGSKQNLSLLANKKADVALVQIDILLNAALTPDKIKSKVAILLPLYQEDVYILARHDINSISELAGKTINLGSENSGSYGTASIIFSALKMYQRINIQNLPSPKAINSLAQGEIDAMVLVAGSPVKLLKRLPSEQVEKITLLKLKGKTRKRLVSSYFPYKKATIKKKHYRWLDKNVKTISVASVMVVRNDLDKGKIKSLLKSIIGKRALLKRSNRQWRALNSKNIRKALKTWGRDFYPWAYRYLRKKTQNMR